MKPTIYICSYFVLFSVFRFLNTVSLKSGIDASVQNILTSDNEDSVYGEEESKCSGEMVRLSSWGRKVHQERVRSWALEDFQSQGGPKAKTYLTKGVPTAPASQ